MSGRLQDKIAIVVGAGQTPGETIGNGRATAVLLSREGWRVLPVDPHHDYALETPLMDDTAGHEQVRVHGQYDMDSIVEHDETITIHGNRTQETVGGSQTETIGANKTITVGGNQTETVGAAMSETVGAAKDETVSNVEVEEVSDTGDDWIIV